MAKRNGSEFRRVRLAVSGDIYDAFYKLEVDFAGGEARLADAFIGYRNIPFLGNVAKTDTTKVERTELLIAITPHIVSGVKMDVGNDRYLGDKAGKGYEEYQPITERKDLLPQAEQPPIEPKTYRDYAGFNDRSDTELLIKGHRYEPK